MKTSTEQNKKLVLEAFDTLFNKHDYSAAEKLWSPNYIQHTPHIPPGREGLFGLIKSMPPTLKYDSGTIVADGYSNSIEMSTATLSSTERVQQR